MVDASQTADPMTSNSDPLAPALSTLEFMEAEISDELVDGHDIMADRASLSSDEESENEGKVSAIITNEGARDLELDVSTLQKDEGHGEAAEVAGESSDGLPDAVTSIPSEEKVNDASLGPEEEIIIEDHVRHPTSLCEKNATFENARVAEANDGHEFASISKPGKMVESEEAELPTLKIDQTSASTCKRTIIPDSEDAEDEEEQFSIGKCKTLDTSGSEGTEGLVNGDSLSHRGGIQYLTEQRTIAEKYKAINDSETVVDVSEGGTKLDLANSLMDAGSPAPSIDEETLSTVLCEKTLDDEEVSKEAKDETASITKVESRNDTVNTSADQSKAILQENDKATGTNQDSDDVGLALMCQDSPEYTSTRHNDIYVQTTFNSSAENSVSKEELTIRADNVTSLADTDHEDRFKDLVVPSSSSSSSFQQPSTVADIPPIEPVSSTTNKEVSACMGENTLPITEAQVVISVQELSSLLPPASSSPELSRKRALPHHRELVSSPLKAILSSSPPPKKQRTENLEAEPGPVDEKGVLKNKDELLMDELRAMKIASIQARNSSLEAEISRVKARLEAVTNDLQHPAIETVKSHIHLLHQYNDIRDVGQGLLGMIAENRGGMRVRDLYEEFGVGLQD